MVGFGPGVEEVLDELAGEADKGEERDAGKEADEGGTLGWAVAGSVGRVLGAEVGQIGRGGQWVSFGVAALRIFLCGVCSLLPGDGAEQAKADDQTEGGGDEDGPGVGGEAERGMSVGGSHVNLLGRSATTRKMCGMRLLIFKEGVRRRRD